MPDSTTEISHKDFVLDRAQRIDKLFKAIEDNTAKREQFFSSPETLGAKFGVTFSHEEAFAISTMKGIGLADLRERLVLSRAGIFDGNCGCALYGPGGVLTRAIKPGL
ncbi:hypothetical protein [Rhizobium sp. BK602]|uniref:hypothetical protein n=1 Tax=Rhizobium sp. BK602 TaxID=2586986 RepID=UPI0016166F5C|nr:hypothetical protein [Rhizobium sp. BK602]MBB3610892.1 hypothetical protein [Rhizobium sp. BK602]